MSKVLFSLDEENNIQFKLSIKGSVSSPNVKPVVRFLITENSANGISVAFPVVPDDNGFVSAKIPPLKEIFSPDKEYIGKLEVIVGNQYFAPNNMEIEFSKNFEVEAVHRTTAINNIDDLIPLLESIEKKIEQLPQPPKQQSPKQQESPVVIKEQPQNPVKNKLKKILKDGFGG